MRSDGDSRRRGGVAVFVLTGTLVVFGTAALAVDGGRLYTSKQRAQNAADAAAFAGGMDLPRGTKATESAQRTATANGFANPQITLLPAGSPSQIEVRTQRSVPLVFARLVGQQQATVTGLARVSRTPPPNVYRGVVPWAIQVVDLVYGSVQTLKLGAAGGGSTQLQPGNFYPLDLNGSGGADYKKFLKWGYTDKLRVGQIIGSEPGNMLGPTNQAIVTDADARFPRSEIAPYAGDSWETFDPGNPRVITIPIVDWYAADSGKTYLKVLGFAAFWVDNFQSSGNGTISGHFVHYVDNVNASYDPSVDPAYDGGVWQALLDT